MFKQKSAIRAVACSMVLASTSLCAFGQITEPPLPKAAQESVAVTHAHPNLAAIKVQDIDQPARAPFQATVSVNINNFTYTPVTIPAGQRLVIDFVSISGATTSSTGPVQPIVLLAAATTGNPSAVYYFGPTPSATVSGQYYNSENTVIYADTLEVGPAFSGYTPSFMAFSVVISGHLISNP